MPSGACERLSDVPHALRVVLEGSRRAVMSTVDLSARPHAVPVCFALIGEEVVTPIDHKPKTGQIMARVRHLEHNDNVALLVDRWDEDWRRLAWLMVRGTATVHEPTPAALEALRERYVQYRSEHGIDAVIVVRPSRVLWWAWTPT